MNGRPNIQRSQRGLTLVELMVALLIGLLLTGGAIQVFLANRAAFAFNESMQRVQENGRFALDTLMFNSRMAGYIGCLSGVNVFNNVTNGATSVAFNYAQAVTGFEAVGTSQGDTFAAGAIDPNNSTNAAKWAPNLVAPMLNNAVEGSDVLVVRNVNPVSHALVGAFNSGTAVFAGATPADYARGDIAIVSDCAKASVFQVTGVTDTTAGGVTRVDLAHAAAGTPGNSLASWNTDQQYADGAQVARAETWAYYVGRGSGGHPALFQLRLQTTSGSTQSALGPAEELVDDVDTMQVRYGVDNDADNDVDAYFDADDVTNWANVVSVRIGLLMRAPEEYGSDVDTRTYLVNETVFDPSDDRRIRQVFTMTNGLRNRLP
ncbi:MAG TPA: PilW family protein [Gammaproteobacteria bacterium]|nr:PilW family protein [Gammaproteobacteria bacterium]